MSSADDAAPRTRSWFVSHFSAAPAPAYALFYQDENLEDIADSQEIVDLENIVDSENIEAAENIDDSEDMTDSRDITELEASENFKSGIPTDILKFRERDESIPVGLRKSVSAPVGICTYVGYTGYRL